MDAHLHDHESEWHKATAILPPCCPKCGESSQIRMIGQRYECANCAHDWPIVAVADGTGTP